MPAGHWLILMTISQLELINRSEVIIGLQMQEVNVIKDALCCRLHRKCLFQFYLNVFVELSLSLSIFCVFLLCSSFFF